MHAPPPGVRSGGPPQPLWPGGAAVRGARFTPRGGFGTIYLASDYETALLEVQAVFRTSDSRTVTLDPQPWVVVSVDGILTDVLDLTDQRIRDRLGTTLAELTGDWLYTQSSGATPPTQLLGRLAYESERITGLLYVSARNPERGKGIAVFAERLTSDRLDYLESVDPDGRLHQRLP